MTPNAKHAISWSNVCPVYIFGRELDVISFVTVRILFLHSTIHEDAG